MTTPSKQHVFACNGAIAGPDALVLNHDENDPNSRVSLQLPKFVDQVYHLPNRLLDLLEIAAYVFAGDRATSRGPRDAVEYHAWPRSMHFHIKVRDDVFWNQGRVKLSLCEALKFMTGDLEYSFVFEGGRSTDPTSLFDSEEFTIAPEGPASVVLFSGGLDSLAGTLERLARTDEQLYLISHRSGQPSTAKTQRSLAAALRKMYPGRVNHYSFGCGLRNVRGTEETQRTRAFLFCCTAFALAHRVGVDAFYAYENGVTSLNFIRRQDLMSARASRTTHPKTHALMAQFLAEVQGGPMTVQNPLWNRTKSDVLALIQDVHGRDLVGSAVSCSKTFHQLVDSTHCGCCFQCIDRRLAAFAVGMQDVDDAGIYADDVFVKTIESIETRTTVIDYVRQAIEFSKTNADVFVMDRLSELADVTPYLGMAEDMAVEAVWELCHRHGQQVTQALIDIRKQFDDPRYPIAKGSLLDIVASRAYLKPAASVIAPPVPAVAAVTLNVADDAGAKTETRLETVIAHASIQDRTFTLDGKEYLLPEVFDCGDRVIGIDEVRRVAADATAQVLMIGETGTGKESLAEFIFAAGDVPVRKRRVVNCAELEATRADSELFGHVKGSFTGADTDRDGILKKAEGGAVFLDEIGALPAEVQRKLLRFVEYKVRRRVGDDTPDTIQTRVLAATNADVNDALVHDLLPRFQCRIELPPLRERMRDLLWLIGHRSFLGGGQFTGISLRALCCLFSDEWSANIRGLQNCCAGWKRMGTGHKVCGDHIADVVSFRGTTAADWACFTSYALAAIEKAGGVQVDVPDAKAAMCVLLLGIADGADAAATVVPAIALASLCDALRADSTQYAIGWLRDVLAARNKAFVATSGRDRNEVCDLGDALAEMARLRKVFPSLDVKDRLEPVATSANFRDLKMRPIRPAKAFEARIRDLTSVVPLWTEPEASLRPVDTDIEAIMDENNITGQERTICKLYAEGKSIAAIEGSPGVTIKSSTIQDRLRVLRGMDVRLERLLQKKKPGRKSTNRPA